MTEEDVFAEEDQNLERCISRIEEIIAADSNFLNRRKDSAPLNGEALNVMAARKKDEIRNLSEARQSPYFGRIDLIREKTSDEIETYYLGEYHIPLDYVFNWRAPIGRLFYNPSVGEYNSTTGKVTVVVNLKRELLIEKARLLDVVEILRLPPGVKAVPAKPTRLTRQLSESKGSELKKIVATIQPEQYEQIASTPYRVLIIQGVAGSGKSEVGIHRIAYLLSPYNELDLSISPNRVILFGPSRVFLKYVSNLLPGLGVERIRQMTIREWVRSTLPGRIKLERKDMLLEKLLRGSRKDLTVETKIAKLKARLALKRKAEFPLCQRTGYRVAEKPITPPFLYSSSANLLYKTAVNGALGIPDNTILEERIIADANRGEIRYDIGLILAEASGAVEECKASIMNAYVELLKEGEVRLVAKTYTDLEQSTAGARRPVEEISLLGMVPGHCRVCRRLGM